MSIIEFLLLLVIAGVCGVLAQVLVGSRRGGFLVSIVVGLVGAFLGAWVGRALNLPEPFALRFGGTVFPFLWALLGSVLFVGFLALLGRREV